MPKKDDLIAEAKRLEIELDGTETVAVLEKMVAVALGGAEIVPPVEEAQQLEGAMTPHEVKRRKVNRGSRRRIERTVAALNSQMDAAIKELDLQAFVADDDGNRVGEWPAVARLREAKARINADVNQLLAG